MVTNRQHSSADPEVLALMALAWTVGQDGLADRLLAVTGIAAEDLRSRAGEPAVLAAVLGFLESHEPDLIACAEAIGATPAQLVQARMILDS